MMSTESQKTEQKTLSPETKKRLEDSISRFFLGGAFFTPPDIVDDIEIISKDDKVQGIFQKFISEIIKAWDEKFPGKSLRLQTKSKPRPMEFDDFSQNNATISEEKPPVKKVPTVLQNERQASKPESTGLKPGQTPPAGMPPRKAPEPRPPVFRLPNCKVGVAYQEKIEGKDESGKPIWVQDIHSLAKYGLQFDLTTQIVSGEPKQAGEFDLDLWWSYEGDSTKKSSGQCRLISNPNSRDLWQVKEPDSGLPYKKPHQDQGRIQGNGFSIVAASRRGRSHEHNGSFRDDDFFIADLPEKGWSVLIVADGAGSAKYSREGSRLAAQSVGKHMVSHLSGEFGEKISALLAAWENDPAQKEIGDKFHFFFHEAASIAIKEIEQEAQKQQATPKDYATTLLAAALKREGATTFLATFWIGDGAIAAYGPRGKVRLMGTPDGGEFAGQTRFLDRNILADQDFGKRIRIGRPPDISAVLLMTDGVSDPFFETDNGLASPEKWDVLWDEIAPALKDTAPEQKLVEWLHFFREGHHDDRTIALLW
jgi:serine/threonine protein phosphatase PrpC